MNIELKQLSLENDLAEYEMLQDIAANENGFTNEAKSMSYEQYKRWIVAQDDYSNSKNLPENFIPQTTYFLYVNNHPIGLARIRHNSSEFLEKHGVGNFGYGIAKSYRGKGYGNNLFVSLLKECKLLGYSKVKSFVDVDNIASNRVFIKNGALLVGVFNNTKNIYETNL